MGEYVNAVSNLPCFVIKNYDVPAWVDERTLVIVSSYSGNTEETVAAYQACQAKGAKIVVVSSGGELVQLAQRQRMDVVQMPEGIPPRAAFGYSISIIVSILEQLFVLPMGVTDQLL